MVCALPHDLRPLASVAPPRFHNLDTADATKCGRRSGLGAVLSDLVSCTDIAEEYGQTTVVGAQRHDLEALAYFREAARLAIYQV